MSLDLSRLIGLRASGGGKHTAQCPVCAAGGNDLTGKNHLVVYPDGKFGCAMDQTEGHYKAIWHLVGKGGSGTYDGATTTPEDPPELVELPRTWPPSVLDRLVKDDSYWHGRGISSETLAPFRGGVAVEAQMKGRYVFPMFDATGMIVGFTGRALDSKKTPKWKHLGKTSVWVWGGLDEIESTRRAVLVESIGDALALMEHGVKDVLCIFGVHMSQAVLAALVGANPASIIVSTNRDVEHTVGQVAAARIKSTLDKLFNSDTITIIHPPDGVKDWGLASPDQIAAAFNPPSAPPTGEDTPPQ